MIREIELSNYRSIIKCKAALPPLAVLIGANGSGKSNVIKALDFVSDIARLGLSEAVAQRGGFAEIVPKSLPACKRRPCHVTLRWRTSFRVIEDMKPATP